MKWEGGCTAYGTNWKCIDQSQQNSTLKAPCKTLSYMKDYIKFNLIDKEYGDENQ
jgi:hypothetical protein